MFDKKKPLIEESPYKSSGAPLKDQTDSFGKDLSPEELRQKLMDKLDHLENMKQQLLKAGHKDVAESFSAEQREIRRLLEEIQE